MTLNWPKRDGEGTPNPDNMKPTTPVHHFIVLPSSGRRDRKGRGRTGGTTSRFWSHCGEKKGLLLRDCRKVPPSLWTHTFHRLYTASSLPVNEVTTMCLRSKQVLSQQIVPTWHIFNLVVGIRRRTKVKGVRFVRFGLADTRPQSKGRFPVFFSFWGFGTGTTEVRKTVGEPRGFSLETEHQVSKVIVTLPFPSKLQSYTFTGSLFLSFILGRQTNLRPTVCVFIQRTSSSSV